MKPKIPAETHEQAQQRMKAETSNTQAMQSQLQERTAMFRRINSPRVSLATGRVAMRGKI